MVTPARQPLTISYLLGRGATRGLYRDIAEARAYHATHGRGPLDEAEFWRGWTAGMCSTWAGPRDVPAALDGV